MGVDAWSMILANHTPLVLRAPFFVPRAPFFVLRSSFFVLRSSFFVLRSSFFVLCALCFVLCASGRATWTKPSEDKWFVWCSVDPIWGCSPHF